jgi:hypothetical protein
VVSLWSQGKRGKCGKSIDGLLRAVIVSHLHVLFIPFLINTVWFSSCPLFAGWAALLQAAPWDWSMKGVSTIAITETVSQFWVPGSNLRNCCLLASQNLPCFTSKQI